MLKIGETVTATNESAAVFLRADGGALALVAAGATLPLPAGALEAVMARYGLPLEPGEPLAPVGALELGGGRSLRHVRHLGRYDVIARDFLLYEAAGAEPVCALAVTIVAALDHLARARRERAASKPGPAV